jgi:formylglycine-generating enzyme required for sulfatase activity
MTKLPPLPKVRELGGDEFEKLLHQLLLAYADREKFQYEPHGKSGAADDGIDGLAHNGKVSGLTGGVAFQFKWLIGNLSKPANARQITKSLADAVASNLEFRHWVLVTPEDITPTQKEWLRELNPRLDLKFHHWGHAKISSLFRLRPDLLAEYYPESARAASAGQATQKLLAAYLDWLVKDCAPLKLRAIDQGAARTGRKPLGLTSVYVDLDLKLRIPEEMSLAAYLAKPPKEMAEARALKEQAQRADRRVPVLEALAHHPRLVLLGAPGAGKSTLAAYLALSLGEAAQGKKKSLARLGKWWKAGPLPPVRIALREFAASLPKKATKGRAQHLWDFLAAELKRLGLTTPTADALQQTARDSGALFLLDGLDEAREASTRDRVLEAVTEFAATAGEHSRFLLTTRPYAWEQATTAQADWPVSYQLADFSPEQIETFIGHWFQAVHHVGWIGEAEAEEKTKNLRQAVKRTDIQPLASNPLLLTLMATLLANRYRLPDDRADLYDEVVKLLLQRWAETTGADRGLLDALNVPGLTLDHVREVMQQLAYDAHAACPGLEGVANINEGKLIAALRPLLGDAGKAELALDYIEKRAGLLLGQGPKGEERQYTFPHRTFQEYLAACWLADQPDFPQRAVDLARQNPAHWREVLTFAARQAKVGRGVPAADALVHSQSIEEWSKANQPGETDWRAAVLAGEQLLEIGLAAVNVQEIHRAVRKRVAGWLSAALEGRAGEWAAPPVRSSGFSRPADGPATDARPAKAGTPSDSCQRPDALPTAERVKAGAVLARLGDERQGVGVKNGVPDIDWIKIPAGPFKMGNNKGQTPYEDECPQFDCDVIKKPFAIARYPVTVAQYQAFVDAGGYGEKRFWTEAGWKWKQSQKLTGPADSDPVFQTPNHPRVGVSWFEAIAFCRWLNGCGRDAFHRVPNFSRAIGDGVEAVPTRYVITLPSEAEWERAARHTDGRKFPWGDEEEDIAQRCNLDQTGLGHTSPVGMFPSGLAECGAADMAGNVFEWTRSLWGKDMFGTPDFNYPYRLDGERQNLEAAPNVARVLRGGSWYYYAGYARCAFRLRFVPVNRFWSFGFRLVASPFVSGR